MSVLAVEMGSHDATLPPNPSVPAPSASSALELTFRSTVIIALFPCSLEMQLIYELQI